MSSASSTPSGTIRVWDPLVRIFHWGLAGSFALAYVTAEDIRDVHEVAGYVAGALIASRIVMGFAGSPYARFRQFVRSPAHVVSYVGSMIRRRDPRYIGHNPLGGLMVMALILAMAGVALTGWLQTTDAYWGVEWVEETHEALANMMLAAVALHLFGVLFESIRHHENLVGAMISGRKRAPRPGDVL
ncbi:cytochrome b/b6 domain-containing protein [Rhizobium sp. SG2393]|uniref:cytochrome b/b6 domain-containing protein n=1 Tax=Rhizobium sp. SG2393 TaxID=3276279 RepID=UPI00366A7F30